MAGENSRVEIHAKFEKLFTFSAPFRNAATDAADDGCEELLHLRWASRNVKIYCADAADEDGEPSRVVM